MNEPYKKIVGDEEFVVYMGCTFRKSQEWRTKSSWWCTKEKCFGKLMLKQKGGKCYVFGLTNHNHSLFGETSTYPFMKVRRTVYSLAQLCKEVINEVRYGKYVL